MESTYFTPADVARRYRLHTDTVYRAIKAGKLAAVRVAGRIRIRAEDAERFALDPRIRECATCEGRIPADAPRCPRCGTPNDVTAR